MKEKTHVLGKFIYPKYYYYIIVCNFFFPHFSTRIRHPQVSGPRFTDTQFQRVSASSMQHLQLHQFCR